jgi:transcriptional regulator NrdR family protein
VEYGVIRRHEQQKTSNRPATVESLVKTAHKIVEENENWGREHKSKLHEDIEEYHRKERKIEEDKFRKSGRLAKAGLPKEAVKMLRCIKNIFSR